MECANCRSGRLVNHENGTKLNINGVVEKVCDVCADEFKEFKSEQSKTPVTNEYQQIKPTTDNLEMVKKVTYEITTFRKPKKPSN